jgi:hypothetical protein
MAFWPKLLYRKQCQHHSTLCKNRIARQGSRESCFTPLPPGIFGLTGDRRRIVQRLVLQLVVCDTADGSTTQAVHLDDAKQPLDGRQYRRQRPW